MSSPDLSVSPDSLISEERILVEVEALSLSSDTMPVTRKASTSCLHKDATSAGSFDEELDAAICWNIRRASS